MKYTIHVILVIFFFQVTNVLAQKEPEATEVWYPEPRVVTPGIGEAPPSDAIILFDGDDMEEWTSTEYQGTPGWEIKDGCMTVVKGKGNIVSKQSFGDIQLHIEWRTPKEIESEAQGRGNSGVFLQSRYEVQVLDSYQNRTYSNGQAGAIYKQQMPLVNACRPPGEWQAYDIIYTAPRFNADGIRTAPAFITVIQNGILIQNHTEVKGTTEYIGQPRNIAHGEAPIMLQDHSNPVSYRNIWVRKL